MGRTEAEVLAVLGEPSSRRPSGTGMEWRYHVLPFYWVGSHGQVFFADGRVTGYEANDD